MNVKKFNKEDLEFYLPETYNGLSKEYILKQIFNKKLQDSWYPKEGDVIGDVDGFNIKVVDVSWI